MSAVTAVPPRRRRMAAWFDNYRAALAERDLRLLLTGLVISATGSWAYNVALLAFVYARTHSLGWVGAAGVVRYVSSLVASPYAGVVAERTERIRLMVRSDLMCAVWQAALAVIAATSGPVVLALGFVVLTGFTNAVYNPAVAATIPTVVGEDQLVVANALNGTIDNLVVIAGPAIGAVLLLLGSPAFAFAVNGASFVASALIVRRIGTRSAVVDVTEDGSAGVLRQMLVGLRAIAALPAARTLVAFCAIVSFVYGTDTVLFVAVSVRRLHTGAEGFGYLLGGLGIGGLVMAGAVDRLARSARLAPIILAGTAGYCLPTALLTVIHSPELAFALQIFRGGATLVVDVLAVTALQRAVDGDELARVFGIFMALMFSAISLGALLTPVLIGVVGLDASLLTMAIAPTVVGLLGLPSLTAIDRASAERTATLAPRVALLGQLDFFAAAARPVLERLAADASEVSFDPGAVVVREGEVADALYVLAAGEVTVTARGERGGTERVLRTMTAPSYFGEIGVLERIPRTATVTAVTSCRCVRIDGTALLDALTDTPASSSLMENARARLAVTHPSRAPQEPIA